MRTLLAASIVVIGLLLVVPGSTAYAAPAGQRVYVVRPGDTLWSIARRTGSDPATLAARNHIIDPRRLMPGQRLLLDDPSRSPGRQATAGPPLSGAAARLLLETAARQFGLNPSFILAVSFWESGWTQRAISSAGAVGLMQIMPATADWAGPALLGRPVDIRTAADNVQLGAALLRRYLDEFSDPLKALAAYYQGEAGTRRFGIFPSSWRYVNGVWALRNLFQAIG